MTAKADKKKNETVAEQIAGSPEQQDNDALEQAESKAKENWDQYLRVAAELENARKRAERDIEAAHKFAVEQFAADLLDVKDSLERGVAAAKEVATVETLKEGSALTLKAMTELFGRFAIQEINPEGEAFDPEWHEAMTMQPTDEQPPNTVVEVVQKGYRIHDRLLRPARVIVAQALSAEDKNK